MRRKWRVPAAVVALLALGTTLQLVAPRQATANPAPNVDRRLYLGGDSVMLGIQDVYQQVLAGWDTTFEPVGGSRTDHVLARIDELQRSGFVFPPVVAILAGNNDPSFDQFSQNIANIQQRLRTSHVVWLNLSDWHPRNAWYNAALEVAAAHYPNMEIADWRQAVRHNPAAVSDDLIHLGPEGPRVLSALIRKHVEQFGGDRTMCTEPTNPVPSTVPNGTTAAGYWLLDSMGGVHPFGNVPTFGDARGRTENAVGLATRPQRDGYWILDGRGAVHARGGAIHRGDLSGRTLNDPPRRIESTPSGNGYWIVAGDGGVFAFGDATFYGSMGDRSLNAQVRAVGTTARGDGYYLVAGDGGVFTFGNARFMGSTGDRRLNAAMVTLAPRPQGDGYWLYASDGGVFTFGSAPFFGSLPGLGRCFTPRAVSLRPTTTGNGYWIATAAGEVFAFGDAIHRGDRPPLPAGAMVVDLAIAA